ncbi:hypothetical protein HOV23_gp106 [Pseudomonas phage Lana]|uniref:Uncharacterized protein n=1 Tax=Pseudomonas phage Lana TaxID=2530172 RepID=A0A481W6G7_9CAUD|nr:hypothetical protein HOV23_gp106 [Pseudomonas phage Lana]QBJ04467.1 hypothetical protein [Pseudomonas phage Lana]
MSSENRTTVEVEISAVLDMDQAADLAKSISALIDQQLGNVTHSVKAVAPFDQAWKEIIFGRTTR